MCGRAAHGRRGREDTRHLGPGPSRALTVPSQRGCNQLVPTPAEALGPWEGRARLPPPGDSEAGRGRSCGDIVCSCYELRLLRCHAFTCVSAMLGGLCTPAHTRKEAGKATKTATCAGWPRPRPGALPGKGCPLAASSKPGPAPSLSAQPQARGVRPGPCGVCLSPWPPPPASTCWRDPLGSVCSAALWHVLGPPHYDEAPPEDWKKAVVYADFQAPPPCTLASSFECAPSGPHTGAQVRSEAVGMGATGLGAGCRSHTLAVPLTPRLRSLMGRCSWVGGFVSRWRPAECRELQPSGWGEVLQGQFTGRCWPLEFAIRRGCMEATPTPSRTFLGEVWPWGGEKAQPTSGKVWGCELTAASPAEKRAETEKQLRRSLPTRGCPSPSRGALGAGGLCWGGGQDGLKKPAPVSRSKQEQRKKEKGVSSKEHEDRLGQSETQAGQRRKATSSQALEHLGQRAPWGRGPRAQGDPASPRPGSTTRQQTGPLRGNAGRSRASWASSRTGHRA